MKINLSASLAITALLAAPLARAGTLYWDGGTANIGTPGNGVSGGTAGNWDTTLTNWDQGNGLAHAAWDNTNTGPNPADTAFFAGTAGAVTLNTPVTVGGLTFFSTSGYSIVAGTQGLTFGATDNTIRLINSTNVGTSTATISGTVGGTGNVILTSINRFVASTLNFTGATTGGWSGTTTLNANTILTLDGATNLNRNLLNTTGITLNGGTISSGVIANNANASADRINNSAAIAANSGTFIWGSSNAGGTYAETLGTVTLNSGQMNFRLGGNLSSGSQTLTLGTSGVGLVQTGTSVVTFGNNANAFNSSVASGNDVIRVNGVTTSTPANQIIGPWAVIGSETGTAFSSFARYVSDGTYGYVVADNLTDTAEGSWVDSTTNAWSIQPGTSNTTADHIAAAVKVYGGSGTWTLNNFNLQTGGIFFSGANAMTIAGSGANGVITALPGGGNLYVTAGQANHIINAPINNPISGGGTTTLVVSGAGRSITLGSTTSNYSGGTVVNSGTLVWTNNANLGSVAANRDITVNGNATLDGQDGTSLDTLAVGSGGVANFNRSAYTFATTTGSGVINFRPTVGTDKTLNLGNASTFTGTVLVQMGGLTNARSIVQFSNIADTAGSALQVGGGNNDSGQTGTFLFSGSSSLTFDNRRIEILPRTQNNVGAHAILRNNSATANIWTINTDLSYLSDQGRDLRLGGTNTGNNAFNGKISNGNVGGSVNLLKQDAGTWILGGANTYTGATTVNAGRLSLNNLNAIATSSSVSVVATGTLAFAIGGTYVTAGTISIAGTGATLPGGVGALWFGQGGSYASTLNAPINMTAAATIGSFGNVMTQTLGGAITGAGPLTISSQGGTVADTATWTIGSAGNTSSYTGNTIFTNNNGLRDITVKLGVTNALPVGTSLSLQASTVTLAHNAFTTFDLNGFNQTLAGLTDATGAANAGATFNKRVINSSGTLSTLTINNAGAVTYGTTGTRVTAGTIGGLDAAGNAANNLALTKTGAGELTLNSNASSFTGNILISNGTLTASLGGLGANPTASGLGNPQTASRLITVSSAGTLNYSASDVMGNSGTTLVVKLVADGGIIRNTGAVFNILGALDLNGGTLSAFGGANATFPSFYLGGTVTVGGAAVSTISSTGTNSQIGLRNAGTTFAVADAVSGSGSDLDVTGVLADALNVSGALIKSGVGTMTLSGNNTFSGKAVVRDGTLSFSVGNASATSAQNLGANENLDLGLASTSSGTLLYTGGAGTLAKNINALGNGTDTIQNSGSGLLTLTGTLTKDGTVLTLKGGSNGITISGAGTITGSSVNSDLIVDGGIVNLETANNYNGPTFIINGATLNANIVNALPTSPARSAVSMDASGTGSSTLALGASQSIASLAGGLSTSTVNLNANTLTVGDGSSSTIFAGKITGTGGQLIKDTAGSTLTLSGTNDYTGPTEVKGGTLLINGTNSGTGLITVSGTATLGGDGSAAGDVTINDGILAAGDNTIGSLGGSDLALNNGSTFKQQIKNDDSDGADLFYSSGNLELKGIVTLDLQKIGGYTWQSDSKITLIRYTGSLTANDLFSVGLSVLDSSADGKLQDNETFTWDSATWVFKYGDKDEGTNYASGSAVNYVTMTVVPEAGTAGLVALGLLLLRRLRRR